MDISVIEISIICTVGLVLGAMGAIIGSTLLVIVPMLSLLGLPIQTAIGTGKVSVIGREIFPAIYFQSKKLVKLGLAIPFSIAAFITSWYGSVVAISLDSVHLEKIVGLCMCLISAIILLNPKIGLQEKEIKPTLMTTILSILLGAMVGFYTGIFGGGANVFIIFGLILIFGKNRIQEIIQKNSELSAKKLLDAIFTAAQQFHGKNKFEDDATIAIIKFASDL